MATRNAGRIDRGLRLVVGVMLLGLYGAVEPPFKYVTLIGLAFVATALSGYCPVYALLGVSTCRRREP
jgi:hydrogenase/urease accessory protein HupE